MSRKSTRLTKGLHNASKVEQISNVSKTTRKTRKKYFSSSDDEFDNEDQRKITNSSSKDRQENVYLNDTEQIISPRKKKLEQTSEPCTPPKQKRLNERQLSEDESAALIKTPSTLLSELSMTSPRRNVEKRSRKSLFVGNKIYQDAKRALQSTTPEILTGREKELEDLEEFIKHHLKEKKSGCLYISGPPGTGKTVALTIILEKEDMMYNKLLKIYVNCTSIKSSGTVFSRIIKELGLQTSGKGDKEYSKLIENQLLKTNKTILLVMDEIDQLESKNQSVLYTIFEWPAKFSNIIIIGIANALDLTDRILPRLQARCELKPKLLHFAPYSKQQIIDIITCRLEKVQAMKIFSTAALQMLAGKVAAVSGDVRRALDIARRVVDMVEKDVLQRIENISDEDFKKVDIKEVISVLNKVYSTSQNLCDQNDEDFPLQQKIIICSLLLILKRGNNKDVTVGKLHDIYKKICSKLKISSVDQAEFVGLCFLVETKGILRLSGKKEPRLHKVTLEWDEEEVLNALKDKALISSILQDNTIIIR